MADEFDEELEREPEGSIITPIFLGCGAMGLGCVFSLGAIVIGLLIFFPGIWNAALNIGNTPMRAQALAYVEANPIVAEALGTPIEATLDDVNEADGSDAINIQVGGDVELGATYNLAGPKGTGTMEVVGGKDFRSEEDWRITSIIVTLEDGREINVLPGEEEAVMPPLPPVPPETVETDNAAEEQMNAMTEDGSDAAEDVMPEEEPAEDAPAEDPITEDSPSGDDPAN